MENFPEITGYRIVKEIGKGATARVFLGVSESSNRKVAIKVLKTSLNEDERYSYRFLKEARYAKKLSHPNIIKIYHIGEPGEYYIVMEYVEFSLNGILKDSSELTEEEKINIFKQIADALQYAHSMGVIHRDIKPGNILLRRDGIPVLTDFGLARDVDSQTGVTKTGKPMGTPAYMSPEQCKGIKVDYRSDIYNLGVVLFQMLTGQIPYKGTEPEILDQHKNSPIPKLPSELKRYQPLINLMMAKKKRKRLSNASEAGLMLEQLYHNRSKKKPDPNEIFRPWKKFIIIYKKWLLLVLLALATFALIIIIVKIVEEISSPQVNISQTKKKPPITDHIDSQNPPFFDAVDNIQKEGALGKRIFLNTNYGGIHVQLLCENLISSGSGTLYNTTVFKRSQP